MTEVVARDKSFDIVKGIAILAVVTHHVLSNTTQKIGVPFTFSWWGMEIANRCVRFAVPTFLMLSALLICRSLTKENPVDLGNYYSKRLRGTVAPFLIWTFLYLLGVTICEKIFGTNLTGLGFSDLQENPKTLLKVLFLGKAAFHLYFFAVLIQAQLILPYLHQLAKGISKFAWWILAVVGVQVAVYLIYYIYRDILQPLFPTTGSALPWYLIPVGCGVWVGTHWKDWDGTWRKFKWLILSLTLISFSTYLTLESTILLKKYWVNTIVLQSSIAIWATGIGLILLEWCRAKSSNCMFSSALNDIGQKSLGIFLIHPAAIFIIGSNHVWPIFDSLPLTQLWVWVVVFVFAYGTTTLIQKMRLSGALFGR